MVYGWLDAIICQRKFLKLETIDIYFYIVLELKSARSGELWKLTVNDLNKQECFIGIETHFECIWICRNWFGQFGQKYE